MKFIAVVLLLALTSCASMVSNRETFIKAEKFGSGGRAQILPNRDEPGARMTIVSNTDIFKYGYWDNRVWGMTNQQKFAAVGWNYSLGIRVTPVINLFYEHHSQHRMDDTFKNGEHFPVEDSIGVVIKLYSRQPAGESIFK